MPTLKVISGPGSGQTVEVDGEVVIGRADAGLTIPDAEISRRHAAVRPAGRGVVVEDLGSTNGTLVDGKRITGPVTLAGGAEIQVGDSVIELELAPETPAPGAATAPAPEATAPAAERPGRPRTGMLVGLGVLAIAVVAAIVVALASGGGDDDEAQAKATKRALTGTAATALVTPPAQRLTVAGIVRGKPVGKMAAIIERFVPTQPRPGGATVPLDLKLAFSQPGGSIDAAVAGRIRLTPNGTEIVRGRARVKKGTGTYKGVKGFFDLRGNNPPNTQVSKFTLKGTLEY